MTDAKADRFRAMHVPGEPFVFPNPWDAGSARILEGLGFKALATTSSGFALTQGRRDYGVMLEDVMTHCQSVAGAVDIPVAADLENGFGAAPDDVSATVIAAAETGLAGGSIEDTTRDRAKPIFELSAAIERITAAAEAARAAPGGFVLTARADGYLHHENQTLDDIIERLVAFEKAGADTVFAPGLPNLDALRAVCEAVSVPVNVLVLGGLAECALDDFADAGAARVSIGGALAFGAYQRLIEIAEPLKHGRFDALAGAGRDVSQFLQ